MVLAEIFPRKAKILSHTKLLCKIRCVVVRVYDVCLLDQCVDSFDFVCMGKKKNSGGKKHGGKKGGGAAEERVIPPGALAMALIRRGDTAELKDKFVVFQMNLMNWEYMNEEITFKTSARIWQVKDALRQLHGRIRDLRVAKKVFDPEHMLGDTYIELDDDEFADKTKHMNPQELSAFKAEQDEQKKKAMDMDMLTLEDYGTALCLALNFPYVLISFLCDTASMQIW